MLGLNKKYTNLQKKIEKLKEIREGVLVDWNACRDRPVGHPCSRTWSGAVKRDAFNVQLFFEE